MPKRADTEARERGSRRKDEREHGRDGEPSENRAADRGIKDDRQHDRQSDRGDRNGGAHPPKNNGARRLSGARAALLARQQVEELLNLPVETISGLARHQDGFTVMLEVVEVERVPRTTDVLATYRVELTADGELDGYERVNRYYRNQAGGREE